MDNVVKTKNKSVIILGVLVFSIFIYLLLKFALPYFAIAKVNEVFFEKTGLELKINKVSFEPFGLQLDFNDMSFSRKHLIKNLEIDLSIENILNKKIVITKINLSGVDLKILKKNNVFSIEDLKSSSTKESDNNEVSDWGLLIKELNITQSEVSFLEGPVLLVNKLSVFNLATFSGPLKTKFNTNIKVQKSEIELSGFSKQNLSELSGEINLLVKDFDLEALNYFSSDSFGRIEGLLNSQSKLTFDKDEYTFASDLSLSNVKIFSKDLKTVDYFIRNLKLNNSNTIVNHNYVKFDSPKLTIDGAILSIKKSRLDNKKKFLKNAEIDLTKINFFRPLSKDSVQKEMSFSSIYNNSGKIKVKEFMKGKSRILDAKISNVDLLPLSETFEESLGYQVDTGKLNLDINLSTVDRKQSGKAFVVLNQLKLDDENQQGEGIKSNFSFPLKTALSLIRDDNGAIDLEVDISGDEDNPEFGFLPLVRTGLGSIVLSKLGTLIFTKAATEFLPLLVSSIPLSPSNVLFLANGSYKFLTKPRFQDIRFKSRSDDIDKESVEVLLKLKEFLLKNKDISFALCPLATTHESSGNSKTIDQEDVLELANKRIKKVKSSFLDMPTTLSQLIFCRPKIVDTETEVGILEISL